MMPFNKGNRRNDDMEDDEMDDGDMEFDEEDPDFEGQDRQRRERPSFRDGDERQTCCSTIIYHYIFVGMMILLCLGSIIAVAFVKDEAKTAFSAVFSFSLISLIIYLLYWCCGRKKSKQPITHNHFYPHFRRGSRNGRK
jgi:hypothetical protein